MEDRRETRVGVWTSPVVVAVVKGIEMQNLEIIRDMIPPAIRKVIYAAYLVAGVVLGVLPIIFTDGVYWLDVTLRVYAYLGVPVGAIALTNVVPNALVTVEPDPAESGPTDLVG